MNRPGFFRQGTNRGIESRRTRSSRQPNGNRETAGFRFFAEHGDDCTAQENVKYRLLALKGIGKWTAGYILMRTAASHDHWPEGDLILRKALSNGQTMIAHAALEQAFSRWSPYRSYATIHIWKGYAPRVMSGKA